MQCAQQGIIDHLVAEFREPQRDPAPLTVRRRSMGECTVASITTRVLQPQLVERFLSAEREISDHLAAHDASRTVEFWVMYHGVVSPESDGPIEICVPFKGMVPPTGAIHVWVEPAREELYTEIDADRCGYPQILQAYAAVDRASRGLRSAGSPRERYVSDWDGSPGEQHVADIVQPLSAFNDDPNEP